MSLMDIMTAPWAITTDKLREIQAVYATHLRGEKIDIPKVEASLGFALNNKQEDYSVHDGVAVLDVAGVIAPKANLMTQISGGASAQLLERRILQAMDDPSVNSLLLDVDSPGGSVKGVPEVAAAVRRFAEKKPVVALCSMACSGGYWIASAANHIYITGLAVQMGSIGVVATHTYRPKQDGVQVAEIVAGAYKRIDTSNAPLTEEGRAYMQAHVDHLYAVFINEVAANRGATADNVLKRMADGRVFIGQQAIDAGLADGVSARDVLMADMAANPSRYAQRRKAVFAAPQTSKGAGVAPQDKPIVKGQSMSDENLTRESLDRDHAALVARIKAEGAKAEMERAAGVRALAIPGYEALIETMAADGKTTPEQAAVAVLQAQKKDAETAKAAHFADAPAAAPAAAVTDKTEVKTPKQKAAEIVALMNGASHD